jgi:hypothetical protein
VHTLKDQIQKYKINKVPREDIKKISSVILSVAKRIWYSKGKSFPENFVDTIISLLQTSSVPPFNEQYKTIALTRASDKAQERVAVTSGAAAPVSTYQNNLATVELLLTMAATFYDGYTRDNTWNTYVKTKSAAPASTPQSNTKPAAALVTGTCFNCGSKDHMLPDCPKPTDDKRIAANKQSIWTQRRRQRPTKSALLPHLPLPMVLTMPNLPSVLIVPTMGIAPMALLPSVPANGILLVKALLRTDSSEPVPTATNLTNSTLKLVVGI